MRVAAEFEASHAFVLSVSDTRKVWEALADPFQSVAATAICADGIEREFNSVDDLCGYENPRSREIRAVSFTARSRDPDGDTKFRLGVRYSTSIRLDMQGPESTVLPVRDRLRELLDGMRPWYSAIAKVNYLLVVFAAAIFFIVVLQKMHPGETKALTFGYSVLSASISIAYFGGAVILGVVLNGLRDRIFPVATFAIGQGAARFELAERIRWGAIIGFIVSAFASLTVAFLYPTT